jgi:hypothetical protein
MPIDCVYFTPEIRCYRDGSVERLFKNGGWKIIENANNCHGGYNQIQINGIKIRRHRIIAYCFLGLDIDNLSSMIDHEDRNPLNNAVNNLRIVTNQENQFNKNAKGYSLNKSSGKYAAYICINGKKNHLGYFDDEADASNAYQVAKLIHHII